jgi:hypothetical protein
MPVPLFEAYELRRIARFLGAILVLTGGIVLLLQSYMFDVLPPAEGYIDAKATVLHLERTGTFQDPAFLVTLGYRVVSPEGVSREMRSGRRVPYEQYRRLTIGDEVQIHYNPIDPFEWRLIQANNTISEYGLGLLMFIFGALSLSLPVILGWASRQKDFEYTDEDDAGAVTYPYGDSRQSP